MVAVVTVVMIMGLVPVPIAVTVVVIMMSVLKLLNRRRLHHDIIITRHGTFLLSTFVAVRITKIAHPLGAYHSSYVTDPALQVLGDGQGRRPVT